ncbi:MAG: enediyne biosynthesis protein UnbU [Planctomycetes bacterium]|nr:enediyne biosynthesis protein UnbU [Planctomycetota bacterium]
MNAPPILERWYRVDRLSGLRRFAVAITVLNVAGYLFLGFEASYAQPFVGVLTAYAVELALEFIDARANRRPLRFAGGVRAFVDFLLPAHISGVAVSMLLYSNQSLAPIAFAAAVAIASKSFLRARVNGHDRHIFNPSNFGIACTLLCFHWVGIAPPYMFTENLETTGDVVFPCVIIVLGTFLNARFTKRLPLIAAWVSVFALQGVVRHLTLDQPLVSTFMPMSGIAFLLFTFYMVTDPPTTPSTVRGQILFGASVALAYGALMVMHVVFGLFFALALTSTARAAWLWLAVGQSARTAEHETLSTQAELVSAPRAHAARHPDPAFAAKQTVHRT